MEVLLLKPDSLEPNGTKFQKITLFYTEYGISFIRKECGFICRYHQYCARKSRTMVVNFLFLFIFFFLEECSLSIFLMVWIHSTYLRRDLPTSLGVLEEARRSSLSAVIR